MIKSAGEGIISFMPPEIAETLSNTALLRNPEPGSEAQEPEQPESGYKTNENQGLENLIEGTGGSQQQPASGQGNSQ
jgi:hypothetical protein